MDDNIILFPKSPKLTPSLAENKRKTIEWIRDVVDHWEADEAGMRVQVAFFLGDPDGEGRVTCGGFDNNRKASEFMLEWIKNHGLSE